MLNSSEILDVEACRICLTNKKPLCPLFKYKLSGNYAEMLTAIADVKVALHDGLPEKICSKCCNTLEKAYLLKTVAERSDKKLRKLQAKGKLAPPTKKIVFDSFGDIKSEIPFTIKPEPKWEMEIDLNKTETVGELSDNIVIANTVIKKVEPGFVNDENKTETDTVDLTWTKTSVNNTNDDNDFFDDAYQDDDKDVDYVPPEEKTKKVKKFKIIDATKPLKIKPVYKKMKLIREIEEDFKPSTSFKTEDGKKSTSITCYPILKNGLRGAPIILRRPKDSTILKLRSGPYKMKDGTRLTIRDGSRTKSSMGRKGSDGSKVNEGKKTVRVVRGVTQKQREKLVCPVCGILTYTLRNHIATHEEKKKFTCSQCPKTFTQKSNLLTHAKQHTGVKDHICEICGAGFYSQKSLVRHNLIHKGERPFACSLCNKRFIVRCDLNRHLRIHSGYKPYKCSTCAMSFNAKHQLQNHERMHTGERPYTCQVCNVAFSYKVNLNNHVYKVHGINLKFKSIHTVTEDVLRREMGMSNETREAIAHILPQLGEVPTPAAHETVPHHSADY